MEKLWIFIKWLLSSYFIRFTWNNNSPSAINYANAGFQWYAAIHATAFGCYGTTSGGTSNFTATVNGQEYYTYYTYTNHVSSSSSTVNLGATFSVSGAGWSVGSTGFSTSNSANTHAESIRSSIASALPSGWSVSRSNNVVTSYRSRSFWQC